MNEIKIEPGKVSLKHIQTLVRLLKEIWLNLWRGDKTKIQGLDLIQEFGITALKTQATLLLVLTSIRTPLTNEQEISQVEMQLFSLYQLYTSPLLFSEKMAKSGGKLPKIDIENLEEIFSECKRPMEIGEETVKKIDNSTGFLEISSPSEQKQIIASDGYACVIPPEQLQIMKKLLNYSNKDLHIASLWVSYFGTTLNTASLLENIEKCNSTRIGWPSFNMCIIVLEHFKNSEDIKELKQKLYQGFVIWSQQAIDCFLKIAQAWDSNKSQLFVELSNAYFLPIFMFYGYVSKEFPLLAITGGELATKAIAALLEIDIKKFIVPETSENLFGSLYFLFSYMCKQITKYLVLNTSNEQSALLASKCNYFELSLKLFRFILSCSVPTREKKQAKKGGLSWEIDVANLNFKQDEKKKTKTKKVLTGVRKKVSAKPLKKPPPTEIKVEDTEKQTFTKGGLDSLEEIIAMLVKKRNFIFIECPYRKH